MKGGRVARGHPEHVYDETEKNVESKFPSNRFHFDLLYSLVPRVRQFTVAWCASLALDPNSDVSVTWSRMEPLLITGKESSLFLNFTFLFIIEFADNESDEDSNDQNFQRLHQKDVLYLS